MRCSRIARFGAALSVVVVASTFAMPAFAQSCGRGTFNGLSGGIDTGWARDHNTSRFEQPSNAFPASVPFSTSNDAYGPVLGGHVGYDLQCGALVFGVEADFAAARISTSNTYRDPFVMPGFSDNDLTISSTLRSIATVRARLGWEFAPAWLGYGTAGFASGRVGHSVALRQGGLGLPDTVSASDNSSKSGWVAGGGVEYSLGRWSVRAEALYVKLAATDLQFTLVPAFGAQPNQNAHWDNAFLIARVGATFRFNR